VRHRRAQRSFQAGRLAVRAFDTRAACAAADMPRDAGLRAACGLLPRAAARFLSADGSRMRVSAALGRCMRAASLYQRRNDFFRRWYRLNTRWQC